MSENKNIYIDELLSEIISLRDSVVEIKNSDSMPFSFFRESFERTQQISHLLHKLEFMQVDDMKNQMEKLVFFLSESEKKGKSQQRELEKAKENERVLAKDLEKEKQKERDPLKDLEREKQTAKEPVQEPQLESNTINLEKKYPEEKIDSTHIEAQPQPRNIYAEGFVLPEYRNPLPLEVVPPKSDVSAPVHIIDIKRGVSLNDRFLFQRELFNNNRSKMNSTIEQLSNLGSYEEADKYIRDNFSWDFEDQVVNDFLLVVKKGFK